MCVDCFKTEGKITSEMAAETTSVEDYKSFVEALEAINKRLISYNVEPFTIPYFLGGADSMTAFEALRAARERILCAVPRSQKATGIQALKNYVGNASVPNFTLIQNVEDVQICYDMISKYCNSKLFARPCPTRPRHGFVDSRPVTTVEEVRDMMIATLEADPDGEMILMPAINAAFNAIWRPGLLAFGPGNDGATSGHNSHSLPLVPVNLRDRYAFYGYCDAMENARINADEVAYIESVIEHTGNSAEYGAKYKRYLVQMRGGPAMESAKPDYIPALTNVNNVVIAEGDLLEWESKAANFKAGTVVYHPGGSLASHYAVHCVLNNVPILITSEPHVGDVLEPNSDKVPLDVQAAVRGVAAGSGFELANNQNTREAVKAMLTGLHNTAVFEGGDSFYIGAAAAIMIRLGIAASQGEARHGNSGNLFRGGRDQVYTRAFVDLFESRKLLGATYDIFANQHWSGGYGGKAWATCTKAVGNLDTAVRNFMLNPREENLKKVISTLNIAVNCAHNNGWWMNKFVDSDAMDSAAQGQPHVFIEAVPVLYALNEVDADVIENMHQAWLDSADNGIDDIIAKTLVITLARLSIWKDGDVEFAHLQIKPKGTKLYQSFNLPLSYMSKVKPTYGWKCNKTHLPEKNITASLSKKTDGKNVYYKMHVSNKHGKCQIKFDDGCILVTLDTSSTDALSAQLVDFSEKCLGNIKLEHQKEAMVVASKGAVIPTHLPVNVGGAYGVIPPTASVAWTTPPDIDGLKVTSMGETVQYVLVPGTMDSSAYYKAISVTPALESEVQ
jgi:hypothetical protein